MIIGKLLLDCYGVIKERIRSKWEGQEESQKALLISGVIILIIGLIKWFF